MCTLIALHRCVDHAGLIIAANRDEFYDRPSEGPALRTTPAGPIIAPLDLRAGGTWFGVNRHRVFVALTNRPVAQSDAGRRSRGHVVTDALGGASALDAAGILAAIPAGTHNPFNAFVADGDRAFSLIYQEKGELSELTAGAHVVANADPDDRSHPKVARTLDRAEAAAELPLDESLDALREACSEHAVEAPGGGTGDTCVHLGEYGTRSSFLLTLGTQRETDRLLYADGPPCETAYDDFTALLDELTPGASYGRGELTARTET